MGVPILPFVSCVTWARDSTPWASVTLSVKWVYFWSPLYRAIMRIKRHDTHGLLSRMPGRQQTPRAPATIVGGAMKEPLAPGETHIGGHLGPKPPQLHL